MTSLAITRSNFPPLPSLSLKHSPLTRTLRTPPSSLASPSRVEKPSVDADAAAVVAVAEADEVASKL